MVASSFAPATMVRYKAIWKSFKEFVAGDWDHCFPASPQVLSEYGFWLSDKGLKPSTIATHLVGVGWWHKIRALEDPSRNYLVKRFLIGLAKEGTPPKQATPIRLDGLKGLLRQLPTLTNSFDEKLLRAVFSLAYFASLRVSEYAVTGSSSHALRLEDVGFTKDGGDTCVYLKLMSFKASLRPAKLLVPPEKNSGACPVTALKEYLRVRPRGGKMLFLQKTGGPLRATAVNTRLRACIACQGSSPGDFSSHSFRAGRTTDLVEMGVTDTQIRESGRWKSDAFLQYVRFDVFRLPKGGPREGC